MIEAGVGLRKNSGMKRNWHGRLKPAAAIALGFWLGSADASGSVDAFLRLQNPEAGAVPAPGTSLAQDFPRNAGWIEITAASNGIENDLVWFWGGAEAGRPRLHELKFEKGVDAATPALFKTAAAGGFYERGELALRQTGADGPMAPFYEALLKNVFVSSVRWNANSGDDAPNEEVSAVYEAIQWSLTTLDARGRPQTAVTVNWNQVTGTGGDGPFEENVPPTLAYPGPQTVAAGGSLTVNPSAGPSAPDGIMSVTLVSAGGYTGGIAVNPLTGTVQLSSAQPAGGPFGIVVRATAFSGLSVQAGFNLTVTAVIPPFAAGADTVARGLGRSIKILPANLLANDSAGAIFDGLPSGTTALGGMVSMAEDRIAYDPPFPDPGTSDSFAYRIRNASGQTATGTVTVTVGGPNGEPSGNLIIRVGETENFLGLTGIPGRAYQLQWASDVAGPWTNLGDSVVADENGSAEWTDLNPTAPRFYRAYNIPPQ